MDKRLKEAYINLLRLQKQKRVIVEYNVQDTEDGGLRVGIQPIKPPEFVYLNLKNWHPVD